MKWKSVFAGPRGIRAGWRFLIFLVIAVLLMAAFPWAANRIGYQPHAGWHPTDFLVSDGLGFVALLLAATVIARIERGRVRDYGLPIRRGAGKMAAFGGFSVSGLALRGRELASFALLWAVVMVILGLFEEFLFRGYPQQALASGMGFWPAAVLISALFGGLHYFTKPRETVVDAASVALIGLFLCLTLWRTGDLWFAVGYHAAFDYVALIVLASPNTGMETMGERATGHLLNTSFHGPAWLTGGDCGLEASWLMFPALAALFLLFSRTHPPAAARHEIPTGQLLRHDPLPVVLILSPRSARDPYAALTAQPQTIGRRNLFEGTASPGQGVPCRCQVSPWPPASSSPRPRARLRRGADFHPPAEARSATG